MPWISGFNTYSQSFNPFDAVGFDQRNVDIAVVSSDRRLEIGMVFGQYNPAAITEALSQCDSCIQPDHREHDGVAYLSWGEDFKGNLADRFAAPLFDHIGLGGRIALYEGRIIRASNTPMIESLIDAGNGITPNLSQNEDFSLAARALTAADAYAVTFTDQQFDLDTVIGDDAHRLVPVVTQLTYQEVRENILTAPPLLPFQLAASGWGIASIDSAAHVVLVLVHETPEIANQNLARLKDRLENGVQGLTGTPWKEVFQNADLSTSGRALIATLIPAGAAISTMAVQLPYSDPLIVYEIDQD